MNKRQHKRAKFIREVILDSVDGKTSKIEACDISTSGIGLSGAAPRTSGELLNLKFMLRQNGNEREVKISGEIKYVELLEHAYHFGVRFL